MRVRSSAAVSKATVWFHFEAEDNRPLGAKTDKSAGVARPGDASHVGGVIRAPRQERTLHLAAKDGSGKLGHYVLGKPVGVDGPWMDTLVKANEASDPYLMTGYDRKTLRLSVSETTSITAEVDVNGLGLWKRWKTFPMIAGESVSYEFPEAFGAYWIRFTSSADTKASTALELC